MAWRALLRQCVNWIGRFEVWLERARLLWIAFLVIGFTFVFSCIALESWEARFRITGMFLELFGLGTVALGLRETRKLFNEPGLLEVALKWLREFPPFYRHTRIIAATGNIELGLGSVTAHGEVGYVASSLEERVSRLERQLSQTNAALQETQKRISDEAQERKRALEAERQSREADDKSNAALLKEALAGGLHLETLGLFWLFLGLGLSTASTEMAKSFTGS